MATGTDSHDAGAWYGTSGATSRLRGHLFQYLTLAASLFGLAMVGVLLVKVTLDAIRPATADPGWLATMFVTVVLPTAAVGGYYVRANRTAGWVGAILTSIPAFGLIFGTGIVVLSIQVLSMLEWFGMFIGLLATGAFYLGHVRLRTRNTGERTILTTITFVLTVLGIPDFGLGYRVLSLSEMVQIYSPALPTDIAIAVGTIALPAALVIGREARDRHETATAGYVAAGGVLAGTALGIVAGPMVGIASHHAIILVLSVLLPTGLYVDSIVSRGENRSAIALPVAIYGGALLGFVVVHALGFTGPEAWLDWQFLTDLPSRTPTEAGFYPAIVGSIMIMLVIIIGIFPLGVGAAIYLEEYATNEGVLGAVVSLIEINIGNLAGVPSVVYGLLALGIFINSFGMGTGTVVVGGLAVGLLILPIIIISAQEAIRAVPDSLRQASYGMGATKWQTVRNVVLPEAISGILTGSILAFGRAIGETAPLLMIGVAGVVFQAPGGFFDKTSAMPRQIFSWASQPDPAFRYGVLAAGVVTLLVVLIAMNATAIIIRNKYQRSH